MNRKLMIFFGFGVCVVSILIWWFQGRSSEQSSYIPVVWTSAQTPAIEASVDGKKCLLELSSANKFFLSLNENGLTLVEDKTPCGTETWHDIHGNLYESLSYRVKNLTIGSITYSNIVAQSKKKDDEEKSWLWTNPNFKKNAERTISGSIGKPFFEKTNLLLDLGHNIIVVTNSEAALKKQGISLDSMEKISLEPEERGLVLQVTTNVGPLRLGINTGATLSIARSSLVQSTSDAASKIRKDYRGVPYFISDLVIGQTNVGTNEIFLTDMSDEITWVDGCLGVDFLKKHLLYIDYQNKVVYIK